MTDDRTTNPKESPLYQKPARRRSPEQPSGVAAPVADVEPGSDADATDEDFQVDPGLSPDGKSQ